MADPPLHVLLLAGRFQVRGSSAYTLRLANKLGAHGIAPRVVCLDARRVLSGRRVELSIREYPRMDIPIWGRVIRELMRLDLKGEPLDLIHIQSWSVYPVGVWLARKFQKPFVLTLHDYLPPRERVRFDTTYGRRIITVSSSVKSEAISRLQLPDSHVRVIHSGVDIPPESERPEILTPGRRPVVGTAGPLEAIKGLPFFLGAARRILAVRPDVEFLIAGAGPEEANLRRLAHDLGLTPHLTFVPNLYDFSQAIKAMDIFCLPSLRQGLGTIMLDAMAMGKPVIATGVGGVYSVIRDNETGLVVPPSNSTRLAERVLELLGDPLRAREIGERGRKLVEQDFRVERMVAQTAETYNEALGISPHSVDGPASESALATSTP